MSTGRSVTSATVALGLCLGAAALAGDLKAPFDFETTAVLPAGVRNPRFKNLVTYMDTKFGGSGGAEPLGYKLNKVVSWQDVINGQKDDIQKAVVEGKVGSLGFDKNSAAGSTSGVVNTYANIKVPVFAMGVTERLTMAVAVPVVSVDVNADTGFLATEQGRTFARSVCEGGADKCAEVERKFNDAINTKLADYGYDPIRSGNTSGVGDIKVVGKYRLVGTQDEGVTLKGEVTLPTGTPPNADKALDIPLGDGQTDLGAMVIYDRFLDRHKLVRANAYAGYTAQLPDSLDKRIPLSETETITRDKETLGRDLGDIVSAGAGLVYEFPFGLNLGAQYGFQYLSPTSYDGPSRFPSYRYSLLSANTGQILHSATLGVGFSSVEMYKAHQFKAPFQVNLAYCRPLAGLNVVKNELLAFELVLFF